MIPLAHVIEQCEGDYLARFGSSALPSHRAALSAMKLCRSTLGPGLLAQCSACGEQRLVPHSCGHRSCPHCQHHESQRWIERQTQALVPGTYFLITFTLPSQLRALAWQHQRIVYAAMMDCAWQTLRQFALNQRQLQGSAGAVSVLHTHSRSLEFHPHVHVAMPACTFDAGKGLWRSLRCSDKGSGYLFSHRALAKVFAAKLLDALRAQGLALPSSLPRQWVVHCKGVGSGKKVLIYLGRYLYRGVIQERDILACDKGQVTYRWRDSKTGQMTTRSVSGAEFLRLLMRPCAAQGFAPGAQLQLSAPQQPALDGAVTPAGVQASGCTGAPATYATASVALSVLRRTDAGAAPAYLADINPCAASSARAA